MNNEPVALTQVEIMNALTLGVPLYTHPVKELTISNNEIHKEFLKLIENCDPKLSIGDVGFPALIEDFARAILRKAQEK